MTSVPLSAVIGDPVAHSRSPALHGYWLKHYNIKGFYVPLHVVPEKLPQVISAMPNMGFVGCNVTIPHKEQMLDLCTRVSDRAKRIGAVNTVRFENGEVFGDNTDGYGFLAHLKHSVQDIEIKGKTAVVLGAGGASRAILDALLREDVGEIVLLNRSLERAETLSDHFNANITAASYDHLPECLNSADLLVNTTSLGMHGSAPFDLPLDGLQARTVVYDLVYQPLETHLLKAASARGCRTVDGLGMLLHQAVPGFAAWFGKKPEVNNALRDAVLAA